MVRPTTTATAAAAKLAADSTVCSNADSNALTGTDTASAAHHCCPTPAATSCPCPAYIAHIDHPSPLRLRLLLQYGTRS